MSRQRGRREAGRETWHRGGDPFASDGAEKQKKRLTGWKRGVVIALGCMAVLALAVGAWWTIFVKAPDVSEKAKPTEIQEQPEQKREDVPAETEDEPETTSGRKEDFFTFLLLGEDTSSGSTDTIMLASYDVANQQASLMSIPRDTMVNVSWDIKRINSVYSSKQGIEGLKTQVSYLTGVMPDFYVIVQWEAVGEIVEALGGVYFDVPFTMNYDDPYQDLHIHQEKGYRLLSGEDAMEVVRWRKNSDGTNYGDTTRVEVQQAFLKALAEQCLKLGNWTKVSAFAEIFAENVETDLPLNNILWFAQQAMGLDVDSLNVMTIPGDYNSYAWSRTYKNNQSYVFVYPEETVEMVNTYFNPYTEEITEDDLQIMYRNKDGSLGVTNGTLADSAAASPPVKSSGSSSSSSSSGGGTADSGTETAADPGAATTTDPGTGETGDLGTGETTDPGTGETTDPGAGTAVGPDDGEALDPGTGESAGSETGETPDLGEAEDPNTGEATDAGDVTDPDTGEVPNPGEAADPSTGESDEPGGSGAADPGVDETGDPGTGDTADPGAADDSEPPAWLG